VLPTGYSFNQDGAAIYQTMAMLFIAQALNVPLTLAEKLTILGVLMFTSKGATEVSGLGFVVLAATNRLLYSAAVCQRRFQIGPLRRPSGPSEDCT